MSLSKLGGILFFCNLSNHLDSDQKSFKWIGRIIGENWWKHLGLQSTAIFFHYHWTVSTKCKQTSCAVLKTCQLAPCILLTEGAQSAAELAFHLPCKIGPDCLSLWKTDQGFCGGISTNLSSNNPGQANGPRYQCSHCSVGMLCVPSCPDVRMYRKTFLDFSSVPTSLEKCSCLRCGVCPICFCCSLAKINSGSACVCILVFLTNS